MFSREAERGDELVIILEGEVEVPHDGALLAVLGPGDFVGEVALLGHSGRRTATVIARTPVAVAHIRRHDLEHLASEIPGLLDSIRTSMQTRLDSREAGDDTFTERSRRSM